MESSYKSPIDVLMDDVSTIAKQVAEDCDQMVYKAIVNCGVTVDKEELIRALQYDRAQYDKGYADAMIQIKNTIEKCKECILDEDGHCYSVVSLDRLQQELFNCGLDEETMDYGVVVYKHRFSIDRSLDDYEETTLDKCIRMGVQYKYRTMSKDSLFAEMQIMYKDETNKLQCLCKDLHDYTFEIKHKGGMVIQL